MHDSKGRKIELGDVVTAKTWYSDGKLKLLRVCGGTSQSDSCNLYVDAFPGDSPKSSQITLSAKETTVILTREGDLI